MCNNCGPDRKESGGAAGFVDVQVAGRPAEATAPATAICLLCHHLQWIAGIVRPNKIYYNHIMNASITDNAISKIIVDFDFDEEKMNLPEEVEPKLDQFRKILIREVSYLLENNLEKLKWILYRVDVDEKKLKKALTEVPPADTPALIADMIITRQIKKAETRAAFKKNEKGDW